MLLLSKEDLEQYIVPSAPATVYYIPGFLSPEEEAALMQRVYAAPAPKWTPLSNRKLQNWGGHPHEKGMLREALPQWLSSVASHLAKTGIYGDRTPNHVLINEYLPGQGIMAHTDGPLFHPVVCTLSTGSYTLLNLFRQGTQKESSRLLGSLLLEPRSLVVLTSCAYAEVMHSIRGTEADLLHADRILNWSRTKLGALSAALSNKLEAASDPLDTENLNTELEFVTSCLKSNADATKLSNLPQTDADTNSDKRDGQDGSNSGGYLSEDTSAKCDEEDGSNAKNYESSSPLESSEDNSSVKNEEKDGPSFKNCESSNPSEALQKVADSMSAKSLHCRSFAQNAASEMILFEARRSTRLSFTIRNVPKVIRSNIFGKRK